MHGLSLYLLAQLGPGQTAAERPDLFNAYSRMMPAGFQKDLAFRYGRTVAMTAWQRDEFRAALAALCNSHVHATFFFPPDQFAVVERYMANGAASLLAFKRSALADVEAHNARCPAKVALYDFMYLNALTGEDIGLDGSDVHLDLVHFRPPVGMRLLKRMLGGNDIGIDLLAPGGAASIERLTADVVAWRKTHASAPKPANAKPPRAGED